MDSLLNSTQRHYQALAQQPIDTAEQAAHYRVEALAGLEVIPNWPVLNYAIRDLAGKFRDEVDKAAWLAAGGLVDADGYSTFRDDSRLGAEVTQHYCRNLRQFRYLDASELPWAVVALDAECSLGSRAIALGGPGSGFLFGPATRGSVNYRVNQELERVRGQALGEPQAHRSQEEILEDQRVSCDAASSLLAFLKAASDQQSSDRITIDELYMAGVLWGDNPEFWPRGWRQRLMDALCLFDSLQLREVTVLSGRWRPRFDDRHRPWHSAGRISPTEFEISLNPLLVQFLAS